MLKAHTLNDQICPHRDNAAHAVEVPPGARMLFCNGQVATRMDGSVPDGDTEQVEIIFEKIGTILRAANMGFQDIVRLTVYVTDPGIIDAYQEARRRYLGDHNPGALLLVVNPFPRPGCRIEVEAIAAKAD